MTILFFSVRKNGKSLGQMAKEELSPLAGVASLIGTFVIMIILIAVLGLVVVNAMKHSPWATSTVAATIPIGEHYGIVNSIQSRYTVLRKLDGVEVIIPNETLIAENIVNHTSSDRKVRVAIDIQIGYNSSVDEATNIMLSC